MPALPLPPERNAVATQFAGIVAGVEVNLKKSVEFGPAKDIQHKIDKQTGVMKRV